MMPFSSSAHRLKDGQKVVTAPHVNRRDFQKLLVQQLAQERGSSSAAAPRMGVTAAQELEAAMGSVVAMEPGRRDGQYMLVCGTAYECPKFLPGCAAKQKAERAKGPVYSAAQLEFMEWAYNKGVADKSEKIGPRKAEDLMALHGTKKGAAMFPLDPYWQPQALVVGTVTAQAQKTSLQALNTLRSYGRGRDWFSPQRPAEQPRAKSKRSRSKVAPPPPRKSPAVWAEEVKGELGWVTRLCAIWRANGVPVESAFEPTFRRSELLEVRCLTETDC